MIPMPAKALTIQTDYANLMAALRDIQDPAISHMSSHTIFLLTCIGEDQIMPAVIMHRNYWIGSNPACAIRGLIKAGLAESIPNPNNRKSVFIKLTKEGRRIAARIRAILAERYGAAEASHDLPADEEKCLAEQSRQPSGNGVAGH